MSLAIITYTSGENRLCSGGSRGGSLELPFETKLFHFHGDIQEK